MSETTNNNQNTPETEPFKGEDLLAKGWKYFDLPKMRADYFDLLDQTVKPENIRWLTRAEYFNADPALHYKRGQFLISPEGREIDMALFAEKIKAMGEAESATIN